MSRVVPSQVVAVINKLFPSLIAQKDNSAQEITLDYGHLYPVSAIATLADQVPQELITLNPDDYVAYTASLAAIKSAVEVWTVRGNVTIGNLAPIRGLSRLNPIMVIRCYLEKCPDEFPAASVPCMLFINDDALRESIRIDVSTAEQAFKNGEWKASTILAGSAIEALLLWKLKQEDMNILKAKITFANVAELEKWNLHTLLEASKVMGIIGDQTCTQTALAKDFRNLIHPGRALRLQQKCTKATALSALASLEHVIEDITP